MAWFEQLLTRKLVRQILRFIVVGGLAFVIDFSVLVALTELIGINYLTAATISFIVSLIFNYILSIYWVFKDRLTKTNFWQMLMFVLLSVMGLLINNGMMWASVELIGINYMIGKFVATAVVMVFNFVTRKILLEGCAALSAKAQLAPDAAVVRELGPAPDSAPAASDLASEASLALDPGLSPKSALAASDLASEPGFAPASAAALNQVTAPEPKN